ncbi:HNH endonuclease [Limnoglobus roseus]|uniref:HNH endonuclease n=1 Tax=Limnoglobus roseus TaxID=2598579 RepID=A0A5C1AJN2_9BACT|nr:HNH endonuclease [Limnoglobus roseus]
MWDENQPLPCPCGLCLRAFDEHLLTKHHMLPKSRGGTTEHVAFLCSQCHGMVHATFTNRTLAAEYTSLEQLRNAPELAGFIKWVRKLPAGRRKKNHPRRRKR